MDILDQIKTKREDLMGSSYVCGSENGRGNPFFKLWIYESIEIPIFVKDGLRNP